jgi:hypothetical protein
MTVVAMLVVPVVTFLLSVLMVAFVAALSVLVPA